MIEAATAPYAVIDVLFARQDDGMLRITSPDVPGLHICSSDEEAACADLIPLIKTLFKLNRGVDVAVSMATEPDEFPETSNLDLAAICAEGRPSSRLLVTTASG